MGVVDADGAVVEEPTEDVAVVGGGGEGDGAGGEEGGGGLEGGLAGGGVLASGFGDVGDEGGEGLVVADGEGLCGAVAVGGGGEGERGAFVLEDAVGVAQAGIDAAGRAAGLGDGAEEVAGGGLVHFNDDVVALTDADVKPFGLVGGDGDEVGGDDWET